VLSLSYASLASDHLAKSLLKQHNPVGVSSLARITLPSPLIGGEADTLWLCPFVVANVVLVAVDA